MEEQKININLSPEVAEGTYSNLAVIAHSNSEFVIDFVRMMPGQKSANVQSRIVMTPDNAKKLLIYHFDHQEKSFILPDESDIKAFKAEKQMSTISPLVNFEEADASIPSSFAKSTDFSQLKSPSASL